MKRRIEPRPALITVGIVLFVFGCWWMGYLDSLQNAITDKFFVYNGGIKPHPAVAVIEIDEKSIASLGRWPWPRATHARLLRKLLGGGARTVMLDVLFLEPDTDRPESDRELGRAVRAAGDRVVLDFFFQEVAGDEFLKPLRTIPAIGTGALHGYGNVIPDADGVFRGLHPLGRTGDTVVPFLSLVGVSSYLGVPPEAVLARLGIPVDPAARVRLNFIARPEEFDRYSYADVLAGRVPATVFKDRLVIVGGTAVALFDHKPVPGISVFPGVFIHATFVTNALQGNFIRTQPGGTVVGLVVLLGLLGGLVFARLRPVWGASATIATACAWYLVCFSVFVFNYALEFLAPFLALIGAYTAVMLYRFIIEEKEKRWIKKAFSHYLSAHVMESILANPDGLKLGGQRQNLTVLFSDIRNFTTMSEALRPEEIVELLNEYLSKMVEVVFRHDGTLDKFIGDAVMAFWGAPAAQNDHARRAVLCALDMLDELKVLQDKWRAEGRPVIEIGIGINTGDMVVGNMGSKDKMDYTVIGDNVNLGSRLESLNKEYKTRIIASAATVEAVKGVAAARPLGAVKVKGKEQAVDIFEITGRIP